MATTIPTADEQYVNQLLHRIGEIIRTRERTVRDSLEDLRQFIEKQAGNVKTADVKQLYAKICEELPRHL